VKRNIAIVGLVLFLIADIALFVVLRQHLRDDRAVAAAEAAAEPIGPTPSTIATGGGTVANGAVGLTFSSSGLLAKVTRGQCTAYGRPKIELSVDEGKTFNEIALPLLKPVDNAIPGIKVVTVRTILQVRVDSPKKIQVIGSDKDCVSHRYDTADGGKSWRRSSKIKTWYVDASGTGVVSPAGASEPGCTVVALVPLSDRNAKVLCTTGLVRGTDDNGGSWVTLGSLGGVTAGTFTGLREGLAATQDGTCLSRAYRTADAGGTWEPRGCISHKNATSSIVGTKARMYGLVGSKVRVSTNAGKSWRPVG